MVDDVAPLSDCFSALTPLSELLASEFFLEPQATALSVSRQARTTAEILVVFIITPQSAWMQPMATLEPSAGPPRFQGAVRRSCSRAVTALPSAWPLLSFMTWPTKKPVSLPRFLSSPATNSAQSSGLAAMTAST